MLLRSRKPLKATRRCKAIGVKWFSTKHWKTAGSLRVNSIFCKRTTRIRTVITSDQMPSLSSQMKNVPWLMPRFRWQLTKLLSKRRMLLCVNAIWRNTLPLSKSMLTSYRLRTTRNLYRVVSVSFWCLFLTKVVIQQPWRPTHPSCNTLTVSILSSWVQATCSWLYSWHTPCGRTSVWQRM